MNEMNLLILALIIFGISFAMTMTGRGGGNFYVLTLVLAGFSMYESASTGQFILFVSAVFATFIFGKKKRVEWKLVFVIGSLTALSAFFGGFFAHYFSGKSLKFVFSFFLLIAALSMLRSKEHKKSLSTRNEKGFWYLKSGEFQYRINLKIAIPIIIATGFGAGMVGVSGGSFLVPLMVLACGVPMNIAVGTSTTMVAGTAFMGFVGHLVTGHFSFSTALPLAIAAAIGGLFGSSFALKTKPKILKTVFAFTTFLAAIIMVINAILSK